MDKEKIRKEIRRRRLEMPAEEVAAKSQLIVEWLIKKVDWQEITSLHCYVPISRLNEVGTWGILKYVWQNQPRIITAVPAARRTGKYEAVGVNLATKWRGLLPDSKLALPPGHQFDLIIVPTLAFDARLFRLGWGGGFYDKFLTTQERALKTGLAFENGRIEKVPNEPHDIKLDLVITEGNK